MNENVLAKWQKDLRETDAAQGKEYLRRWNEEARQWEYCCLGRLCEISGLAEWVDREIILDDGSRVKLSSYFGATQYLPNEVAEWAELLSFSGADNTAQEKLAEMNDEGTDFNTISYEIPEVVHRCEE